MNHHCSVCTAFHTLLHYLAFHCYTDHIYLLFYIIHILENWNIIALLLHESLLYSEVTLLYGYLYSLPPSQVSLSPQRHPTPQVITEPWAENPVLCSRALPAVYFMVLPGSWARKESTCSAGDPSLISIHPCVCAQSLQLCPTLWEPVDCSLPGSSVSGILQALYTWQCICVISPLPAHPTLSFPTSMSTCPISRSVSLFLPWK